MTPGETRAAIRCPTCGAGLDVLGGGRVTTHVCPYCASALDATQDYRLLETYTGMPRAQSPLAIGMQADFDGLSWQIIGILTFREDAGGSTWTWVDHLLFSATHGYAWLTLEDGHLLFTRRWRKGTSPAWIGTATVEAAENRPTARAGDESFTYYETSTSRIVSVEGEFTWRPHPGDETTTVTLLGDSRMLSFVEGPQETEVEMTSYPDRAAVWAAFGIADPPPREAFHPLAPGTEPAPHSNTPFVMKSSGVFAALSLALALVFFSDQGTVVQRTRAVLPATIPFTVDRIGRLTQIELAADIPANTWAWLEPAVTDPNDQPLFEAGREVGFYSGVDADGSWTEGSRVTQLSFHPQITGTYEIDLDLAETGVASAASGSAAGIPVQVTVRVNRSWPMPPLVLGVAFALLAGLMFKLQSDTSNRRFAGSDWDDED